MSCVDASVDDVGAGAGTGAVVVGVGGAARFLVGDAAKAPRSILLRGEGVDGEDGILLNVVDLPGASAYHAPRGCNRRCG